MTATADGRRGFAELATTGALAVNAVLGLAAQVALASRIGPGTRLDQFLAATAMPLAVVGISVVTFSAVIVPRVLGAEESSDARPALEARLLAGGAVLALAISALGFVSTWLVPGSTLVLAALPGTSRTLLLAAAWSLCFGGLLAQLLTAFHSVRHSFVLPAATSWFYPLALLIATGGPVAWAPQSLASAYAGAAVLQVLVLSPRVRRDTRVVVRGSLAATLHLLRGATPVIVASLASTCFTVSDAFWSRRLQAGGLSYLSLATRLTIPVAAIATTGFATIAFPRLVTAIATGERSAFRRDLSRLLALTLTLLAPLAAVGIALREPLVRVVLEHGAFRATDRDALVAVLPGYLVGMVCAGLSNVLSRALYAQQGWRRAAMIGAGVTLVYAGGSGFAARYGPVGFSSLYAAVWVAAVAAQLISVSSMIRE